MERVATENAPQAIGPYSQAIVANGLVFASGQIGLVPSTMEIVEGGIVEQTDQVMQNLQAVLASAGTSLQNVVKTTVYLKSMNDFPVMNAEYERHLGDHRPARATVEVSCLPKNVLVEIDCIAVV